MRWFWVDRFLELKSGESATSIKNVSLAEEHLHDHFPGFPVMPASLIVEGLAQTGGILLGEKFKFDHIVVLAKVPKMKFHGVACPGDQLRYHAELVEASHDGGMVTCTAHVGDRLVAEGEIVFAHLDNMDESMAGAVDQKNFVFSMGLMSILDVNNLSEAANTMD